MSLDMNALIQNAEATLVAVGWKVAGSRTTFRVFPRNPYRRVELTATISNAVDYRPAILLLKQRLATILNILLSPAPGVDVLQFTPAGPQLCVRPYCSNQHYWHAVSGTFAPPPLDLAGR
jgi:small-conductance mechanosensitive channel